MTELGLNSEHCGDCISRDCEVATPKRTIQGNGNGNGDGIAT